MIRVSADKGKFIIICPFHMAAKIRDVPGKRWSSPKRAYVVPFSRKAAETLSEIHEDIIFDDAATVMMASASHPKPIQAVFPEDYPFKTTPMKKQLEALNFLWGKTEGALFMAMRTGKTKVIIDWATALKISGEVDHVLVFPPLAVKSNWVTQFADHCPIDHQVGKFDLSSKSGQRAQKAFSDSDVSFKIMVVGIESMSAGGAFNWAYDFIAANKRVMCVVDESHFIKTHNANCTEKITMLGTIASHRAILTGTPITKSPLDLYGQFQFLNPYIIGYSDYYSFKNRYAIMGGYENRQIVGYDNIEELMADIAPYTFQVTAEEAGDLPPKIYMTREVEIPAKIRVLYNQIKRSKLIPYNGKELVLSGPLDRTLRLMMLINGVMATGESGTYEYNWVNNSKINELMNLIDENPTPSVIWTNSKMELRKTVEALNARGLETREMHGGVNEDDRIKAVADFQNGVVDYFVANVSTGGTGIKLSRARMLVYMSNSFKYVDRKQSEERATDYLNPGESVLVVDIVALDSYDVDVVQASLTAKQDVAEYVRAQITNLKINEGF